ncbi:MAG TPA: hypothetical protein VGI03_06395 [Verrucomicrobiae bacterium]|jgi:hypothetical protein
MTSQKLCSILFYALAGLLIQAAEVVQIDVRPVLTGRAVTTVTDGKLVSWTQGVDGGGRKDGYMTVAASIVNGDTNANALPDDGCFQATASHPLVQLNFNNADSKAPQTRSIEGEGGFTFSVPDKRYQRMIIFVTSAEGPAHLSFKLTYADGTFEQTEVLLPDYYNDPSVGDTNLFSLAANLAKWDSSGRMKERSHHHIHGLDLHPDAKKELLSVQVAKTAPGYFVFWGATGVTAN